MRVSRVIGAFAAGTLLTCAGMAEAGPKNGRRAWQPAPTVQRANAIRMAWRRSRKSTGRSCSRPRGLIVPRPAPAPRTRPLPPPSIAPGRPQQLSGLDISTGFLTCGSNATNFPGTVAGSRWYTGATSVRPRTFDEHDALAPGSVERTRRACRGLGTIRRSPATCSSRSRATEDFGQACQFPAAPGPIDGVIFEFLGTGGTFYADEDLTTGTTRSPSASRRTAPASTR